MHPAYALSALPVTPGAQRFHLQARPWHETGSPSRPCVLKPCTSFSTTYTDLHIATGEPAGDLWRAEDHDYSPNSDKSARTNAALISLVRNEEMEDLVKTMKDIERTWNNKFNYPYIFFNDVPFTEEFKKKTQEVTKAKCQYGMVTLEFLITAPAGRS